MKSAQTGRTSISCLSAIAAADSRRKSRLISTGTYAAGSGIAANKRSVLRLAPLPGSISIHLFPTASPIASDISRINASSILVI